MRPLKMSMVVSQPGMMGHVVGSQVSVVGVEERLGPAAEEEQSELIDPLCISLNKKSNIQTKGTHSSRPLPPVDSESLLRCYACWESLGGCHRSNPHPHWWTGETRR